MHNARRHHRNHSPLAPLTYMHAEFSPAAPARIMYDAWWPHAND
jgi:hypothetical protein